MAMTFNSASFFVLAVCLTAISLFGQITGDLQVRVADATDAVVPNAVVTVKTEVVSGDIMTVPVTLNVAAANQQVEVREEAAALNTVNVQLQQSTDNQTITDLPLNSTGVLGLAALSPGVIPVTPNDPFLGLGSYNSNGGRGRANNITLDNAIST